MRRILLIAAAGLAVIVVAVGFSFGWIVYPRVWRAALGPRTRPLRSVQFERTAARAERGRYLAEGPLTCFRCHSDRDWSQPGAPPVADKIGAGHIFTEDGRPWLVAPNITPDRETGAGTWTDDMFARAIREGITSDPSGISYYDAAMFIRVMRTGKVGARVLNGVMPWYWYRDMSDEDLKIIFEALKQAPKVKHIVDNTEPPTYCKLCRQSHGGGSSN